MVPFGITLSNDQKRLYVALSGLNAIAVVDTRKGKTLGYISTGWYPTKLQISPDDQTLYVVTARGLGSGPNGGPAFVEGVAGTYVGDIMQGTFEQIDLSGIDLKLTTRGEMLLNWHRDWYIEHLVPVPRLARVTRKLREGTA